jgi:hypothetical protein
MEVGLTGFRWAPFSFAAWAGTRSPAAERPVDRSKPNSALSGIDGGTRLPFRPLSAEPDVLARGLTLDSRWRASSRSKAPSRSNRAASAPRRRAKHINRASAAGTPSVRSAGFSPFAPEARRSQAPDRRRSRRRVDRGRPAVAPERGVEFPPADVGEAGPRPNPAAPGRAHRGATPSASSPELCSLHFGLGGSPPSRRRSH